MCRVFSGALSSCRYVEGIVFEEPPVWNESCKLGIRLRQVLLSRSLFPVAEVVRLRRLNFHEFSYGRI